MLIGLLQRLEKTDAEDEHDQHRQKHVGCISIDMADMHPPGELGQPTEAVYRRLKDPAIDDVDFGGLTSDRRPKMLSNGLRAVLDGGRNIASKTTRTGLENPVAV